MDRHEQRSEQASQRALETSILKQLETLHDFVQECKECQQELESHWQFCAHCGSRLATQCPGCGNPLPPAGAPTCPRCGLDMPPGAA